MARVSESLAALDSACNRTVCGPLWLEQALERVPGRLKHLVASVEESEKFRFGNGGVLTSTSRTRLPAVVDNKVVCVWLSCVPNPRLGCLLGKDTMEALGTVIDFEDGVVTFKLLDLHDFPLYTLKAGHYGVDLCSKRPFHLSEDLKFRKMGKNGPVEIPMKLSAWVGRKFRKAAVAKGSEGTSLVENFVSERALLTTTSPTAASARARSDEISSECDHVGRAALVAAPKKPRKMAAYARAGLGPRTLALVGFASLACPFPAASFSSLAAPRGYEPAAVEGGRAGDGPAWKVSGALVAESRGAEGVHGLQHGLDDPVPQPAWTGVLLHGGRDDHPGNPRDPRPERSAQEDDAKRHRGSAGDGAGGSGASGKTDDRPSRRASDLEAGSDSIGGIGARSGAGNRHRRKAEGQAHSSLQGPRGQEVGEGVPRRSSRVVFDASNVCNRDPHAERGLPAQEPSGDGVAFEPAANLCPNGGKSDPGRESPGAGVAVEPVANLCLSGKGVGPFNADGRGLGRSVPEAPVRAEGAGGDGAGPAGVGGYGIQDGRPFRPGLKQIIRQGIAKVRRLASLVCPKSVLQEALETCVEEDYSKAIQDHFLCVPEGQEMIAYAERQGHRVKQDAEGELAANFFAEANPLGGTERTGTLRARIAAKKLGYRLKPYLAAGRPYVLLVTGDPSPWQAGLWQVCPELRDPGNYLVKIAKGALLTNVEGIAVEQEYLSRYGPKMARMRVLSLLEKEPPRISPPVPDFEAYANDNPEEESEPEDGQAPAEEDSELEIELPTTGKAPSKEMIKAVYRLHQNTGHTSKRRLARALIIAGAPPEAVQAAKMLKCSVRDENKKPNTRMPTALPRVEHPGDHVCADLFSVKDSAGKIFWIAHFVDLASRYQVCRLLLDKTAEEVVKCLSEWVRVLGAPKALTVDMGPEFVATRFQSACDFFAVCLRHTPVESPWKNAVAERSGQTTKAILKHLITEHSALGRDEMDMMIAAASEAYNGDVGDSGFSPAQFMLGKQPRTIGDGLALAPRLSQLGVLESQPSMARQVAIRETAKVAMIRMRFSTTLRKALAARPRVRDEVLYEPGEIIYFWRQQAKGKRLPTKRWHGPAMVVAVEKGETGVQSALYASYRGGVTKVAVEHARPASSLERLAAGGWETALQGVLDAVEPEGDKPLEEGVSEPSPPPAPGESSAAADVLRDLSNEPAPPPVVVIGAPSEPNLSRRASADFSRASSSWERRGHEQWARAQSGAAQSQEPEASTDRKRNSAEAGLPEPQAGGPGEATVPEGSEEAAPTGAPGQPEPPPPTSSFTGPFVPLTLGGRDINVMIAEKCKKHPLWELQEKVAKEIANGDFDEPENGTWDGRWPTPSESTRRELCRNGALKNLPSETHDVLLTSGGKEFQWSKMDGTSKAAFQKAAEDQWSKWVDNEALEPIPPKEADALRKKLASQGKLGEILIPRFVLTDKNAALSTKDNPLPLKANARMVVPGYRDSSYLAGKLQTDAPTASRVVFFMTSCC